MGNYLDVGTLTTPDLAEEDIPLRRGTVRVRALNRAEAHLVSKANGSQESEALILRFGMVEPKLSKEQVNAWMNADRSGEIEHVIRAITRLSGMGEGSDTERYKSNGAGPGDRG